MYTEKFRTFTLSMVENEVVYIGGNISLEEMFNLLHQLLVRKEAQNGQSTDNPTAKKPGGLTNPDKEVGIPQDIHNTTDATGSGKVRVSDGNKEEHGGSQ